MGTVFVTVADQHGNNAERFYKMFPAESVLPAPEILRIDRVVRVPNPSLVTLLQAIARRGDRDIVVVSHGVPTQLAIPVMPGIRVGLDAAFVDAVLGNDSDAILGGRLDTNARNIETLRAKIQEVQHLGLRRLEFRACRVGASLPTLEALGRLFGASVTCAPRSFDGYGPVRNVRPTPDAATVSQWQRNNPGYQTFGASPNRFFWVNNGSVDPPGISDVFAESWDAVRGWVEAKFASGTNHRFHSGTFYYHIQVAAAQDSSSLHGSRTFEDNFVFPTDPEYWQNLIEVTSSGAALPASPHGAVIRRGGPIGLDTQYAALDALRNEPGESRQQARYRNSGPEGLGENYS